MIQMTTPTKMNILNYKDGGVVREFEFVDFAKNLNYSYASLLVTIRKVVKVFRRPSIKNYHLQNYVKLQFGKEIVGIVCLVG